MQNRDPVAQTRTLIEHWDGQRWRIVPSQNLVQQATNMAVGRQRRPQRSECRARSCVERCLGCWQYSPQGFTASDTLLEHWNEKHWSIVPSPDPGPRTQRMNDLFALAATPTGKMWVVGLQRIAQNLPQPLIEVSTC